MSVLYLLYYSPEHYAKYRFIWCLNAMAFIAYTVCLLIKCYNKAWLSWGVYFLLKYLFMVKGKCHVFSILDLASFIFPSSVKHCNSDHSGRQN